MVINMSLYDDYVTTNRRGPRWAHPLYMRAKTRGGGPGAGPIVTKVLRFGKDVLGVDLIKEIRKKERERKNKARQQKSK